MHFDDYFTLQALFPRPIGTVGITVGQETSTRKRVLVLSEIQRLILAPIRGAKESLADTLKSLQPAAGHPSRSAILTVTDEDSLYKLKQLSSCIDANAKRVQLATINGVCVAMGKLHVPSSVKAVLRALADVDPSPSRRRSGQFPMHQHSALFPVPLPLKLPLFPSHPLVPRPHSFCAPYIGCAALPRRPPHHRTTTCSW
jgi:hypothetical protein